MKLLANDREFKANFPEIHYRIWYRGYLWGYAVGIVIGIIVYRSLTS